MSPTLLQLKVRLYQASALVASFLILTACGSTVSNQATIGSPVLSGTPLPSITGSGSGSCANSGLNTFNLPAADSEIAEINGSTGTYPTYTSKAIPTSRTLKVKVTPLSAPNLRLPGYTNWVFPYGCVRVRVTVNGVTQSTQILQVDGVSQQANSVCANSPTYQVLDFSNDITGNGTVNVVVSNADYDNCRYTNPLQYGCSMSAEFQSHEVETKLDIQSDGTYMCY